MIITLFVIAVIEFSIYLILEFMAMKNNKNQKLNDNEYDKLNTNCSRVFHGDSDICTQSDKELNEREKA